MVKVVRKANEVGAIDLKMAVGVSTLFTLRLLIKRVVASRYT